MVNAEMRPQVTGWDEKISRPGEVGACGQGGGME
jgi:hypothetical protein